jgi:hypothetical protein
MLFDHKRNQDIMRELKIRPDLEIINYYKHKWIQHVRRMDRISAPVSYYDIPIRGTDEPRPTAEETPGLLYQDRNGPRGQSPWEHDDDDGDYEYPHKQ